MLGLFKKKGFLESKEDVFHSVKRIYDITVDEGFLIFETDVQRTYIAISKDRNLLLINDNLGDVVVAINEPINDLDLESFISIDRGNTYYDNSFWKFFIDGKRDGFFVNRKIYSPERFTSKLKELVH